MNADMFALIVEKYAQLNTVLCDVISACEMSHGTERTVLVESIKHRTNHTGIHYTAEELRQIFLGRHTDD